MGYGKIVFSEGTYFGEVKNGKANGYGVINFDNGDVYIGEMADSCMTGMGAKSTSTYVTLGKFVKGKRQGHCCTIDKKEISMMGYVSKADYYIGNYDNDVKSGRGILLYHNADVYDGNFQDDLPNGKGCLSRNSWMRDGYFADGNFVNGKLSGKYLQYAWTKFADGDVFYGHSQPERRFYNGYGEWIDKGPSPERRIGYHNKFVNERVSYNFKGAKIYGGFVSGDKRSIEVGDWGTSINKYGKFSKIYKNGNIYIGNYYNSKRSGGTTCIIDNGKVKELYDGGYGGQYRDGNGVAITAYGNIDRGRFSVNDLKDGISINKDGNYYCWTSNKSQKHTHQKINIPVYNGILNGGSNNSEYSTSYAKAFVVNGKNFVEYLGNDTAVYLPVGITKILDGAFSHASSFVKEVYIPHGVEEIENNAFKNCTELEYVLLPKTLGRIGCNVFENCKKLNRISIPDDVYVIGTDAFSGCESLPEMTIPHKTKSIYTSTFKNCKSLKTVSANSVDGVYADAFAGCTSLKNITVQKGCFFASGAIPSWCRVDEVGGKKAPQSTQKTTTAKSTQAEKPKQTAVVSDSVVKLPNLPTTDPTLFKIENGNCKKYLGKDTEVVIPSGITKVGSSSFGLARKFVKYIAVPEGVREIGSLAFSNCKKLETVVLPSTLKRIKNQIFDGCDSLSKIVFPNGCKDQTVLDLLPSNCQIVFKVEKEEAKQAEAKTTPQPKQTETVPKQEEKPYVWQPPKELESDFRIEKELLKKYVGKSENVVVPNGTTRMWEGAFDKAKDFLKSVTLPEGFVEIPQDVFKDCVKLEEVYLPATLQKIGFGAFSNCPKLQKVCLANNSQLKDIRSHAFEGCDSLKQIVLPKDCQYEKEGCLASFPPNCKVYTGEQPKVEEVAQQTEQKVEKPTSKSAAKKSASTSTKTKTEVAKPTVDNTTLSATDESLFEIVNGVCKKYLGRDELVVLPNGVKKIGSSAFRDNLSVKHVVLPEGAKEILTYAFAGCETLQRVDLPSSLRAIKTGAFWGCASLKQIDLPDGIKQMGSHVFSGCASLQKVVIPSCVDKIESFAFDSCKNLSQVVFADSIKELEFAAFDKCDSLKEVTLPKGCKLGYFISGPFPNSCKINYR